jgi:FkbM family methyltransferase
MAIISYAQNFEDVMLWRALGHVDKGFYIDIGAQDPVVDSVSLAFYEKGWRGVHAEPTAHYAALLRQYRPDETVLQVAVGVRAGIIKFFEIPESGISTADETIAEQHRSRGFNLLEISVPCVTLATVLQSCGKREVHWLKIDVEGMEEQVLKGWKPSRIRPWIVVVESTLPLTQIESYESWEPTLLKYGYSYAYFDGLNRYYVSHAKKELQAAFSTPPNVFDGFSISGTASTDFHRFLAARHREEVATLSGRITEQTRRESEALSAAFASKQAAEAANVELLLEYREREERIAEKFDSREREVISLLAAVQEDSTRQLAAMNQQLDTTLAEAALVRKRVTVLEDEMVTRERHFSEQLARIRETMDAQLAKVRSDFESQKSQLIDHSARLLDERESVLRSELQVAREEGQLRTQELVDRERALVDQLAAVKEEMKYSLRELLRSHEVRENSLLSELNAHREAAERGRVDADKRAQLLIENARLSAEAAHAESRAQLLQMIDRETENSHNLARLHSEMLRQGEEQVRIYLDRENTLRGELSSQLSYQLHSFEQISNAFKERERELKTDLGAAIRQADVLSEQLSLSKRQMEAAQDRERALNQSISESLRELKNYQGAIAHLESSMSWRLTAPFRRFFSWLHLNKNNAESHGGLGRGDEPSLERLDHFSGSEFVNNYFSQSNVDMHVPPFSPIPAIERTMIKISHVNHLLELHDVELVHACYQSMLDRAPDEDGGKFYLARLRSGVANADIVFEIAQSAEARTKALQMAGLREFVDSYRPAGVGGFRAAFARLWRVERLANRLENEFARSREFDVWTERRVAERLNDLESAVSALNEAGLARLSQQTTAAIGNKLHLVGAETNNRFDQMEAAVSNLHQSFSHQMEVLIEAQSKHNRNGDAEALSEKSSELAAHQEPVQRESANMQLIHSVDQFEPTSTIVFPLGTGSRKLYYYIDHTAICPVNTGMQRVARRLARALLEAGEQLYFVKWSAVLSGFTLVDRDELAHFSRWHGPALEAAEVQRYPAAGDATFAIERHSFGEAHWLVVPEVTHITYQPHAMTLDVLMEAKRLGLRSAFVYYDATPLRRAELAGMAASHETYMQQLLLADLILPISDWSARDLASYFHIHEKAVLTPTPRIVAMPLPGESQLASRVTRAINISENQKLIVCVGSITPHKNQLALVRAFEKFCESHPETEWQLSLAGNLHPDLADDIRLATKGNARIQYLEHIPDERLDELYRRCAFTVFPSVEEGFGLPILESLWYGKPCICANFGAMGEVAEGGGCYTIDMRNNDELLRALDLLINTPDKLKKLSKEAVKRDILGWSDYGQQFIAQLNDVGDPLKRLGVIYYWVDHTVTFYKNTGIQRVVRGLARALMERGLKLVPVKWDQTTNRFFSPSTADLEYLSKWNGPAVSSWAEWTMPEQCSQKDWLLIPELILYLDDQQLALLKKHISEIGLRCAWIFYDAIPWKMREIFPASFTEAHGRYMEWLSKFELIFPISDFSRGDLISFLGGTSRRTPSLEQRIQTCVLPGEFHESDRVTIYEKQLPNIVKILCVGTVEPRKNHLLLLSAFAKAATWSTKRVELYIVGRSTLPELAQEVRRIAELAPNIFWEQEADDTRLHALFLECDFTVYPSLEEGFGLPILESLWNARPCICRNSGAMAEVATAGGCFMVDTADEASLAHAIYRLTEDHGLRTQLAIEAINLPFKKWGEYAREVATRMVSERHVPITQSLPTLLREDAFYDQLVNLPHRPLLSVCISTYNRAKWLALNLRNLANLLPNPIEEIEIVVCDNTSTDDTQEVVKPYLPRTDFRYYRNPENVGMLGNLRVTAHHARGQYIWILGDDDLVRPGGIENVLQAIRKNPELALVYLNYGYTREEDATSITDLDKFFREAPPICPPSGDIVGTVSEISTESENFFTAIYCLVFRRDHAMRAYSQNIEGRPFSTLLTCIPTTYYALNFMMNEPACWLGQPQLVVNLNVSWMKYAPLWILERIPEAYDLAERMGANAEKVDRWRNHTLSSVLPFFKEIYEADKECNSEYFLPSRLIGRIKHLDKFADQVHAMKTIYESAHLAGHPKAQIPSAQMFRSF